ncbi:hypothetical protein QE450_000738 [Paenibacillus sp. SORGH_AS306]|uniref:hypothetical protein n=1 Tax=unclassified Paenibacillus TaxID=185978 RepID=UPI0027885C2B|nr:MULTISPECIES: hypothetical protein [unclassified Paenibacillus]MDQ1233240.1 hypothetical protein [Paenibacillus sp. SORGH_AS_0306]MDR6110284.1 hypothetical protein [Paenibacillus sp. SORGH_AS_0338]
MNTILRWSIILMFSITSIGWGGTSSVSALSCAYILTVEDAYAKYDGVVIAQVKEIQQLNRQNSENHQVVLTILKSYKNIQQRQLIIKENSTWGALNGPSEVGNQYIFFLNQKDGEWENPLCGTSKKVSELTSVEYKFLQDKELALPAQQSVTDQSLPSYHWIIAISSIVLLTVSIFYFLYQKPEKHRKSDE